MKELSSNYLGYFIVLEGIDGCGSTTHSNKLAEWLKNHGIDVEITKEPSPGRIGVLLRDYLKEPETHPAIDALLFAADRVEHYYSLILPSLNSGKIIVSDRHKLSSMVYQVLSGLEDSWVKEVNRFVPEPDLQILLDCDHRIALERTHQKQLEKFEVDSFLEKARKKYITLANEKELQIVDSSKPLEEVQTNLRTIVKQQLLIDRSSVFDNKINFEK